MQTFYFVSDPQDPDGGNYIKSRQLPQLRIQLAFESITEVENLVIQYEVYGFTLIYQKGLPDLTNRILVMNQAAEWYNNTYTTNRN